MANNNLEIHVSTNRLRETLKPKIKEMQESREKTKKMEDEIKKILDNLNDYVDMDTKPLNT